MGQGEVLRDVQPARPVAGHPDQVDPAALALRLTVNGECAAGRHHRRHDLPTRRDRRYLSQFMVLYPGDVISTGTPAGVALAGHAPYLQPGDVVELTADGLGTPAPEDRSSLMQDIGRLDSPPIDSDTGARSHQGLRAIVTGGASGIGAAITAVLLDRGATVVVLDLQQSNALGVISITCAWGNDDSVRAAVTTAVAHLGGLDILVNNAGIGAQGTVEDNADDEWRRVWEVNVLGTVRLSRACLPHLRRSGAPSIVKHVFDRRYPLGSHSALSTRPRRARSERSPVPWPPKHVHEGIRVNAVNPAPRILRGWRGSSRMPPIPQRNARHWRRDSPTGDS